MYCLEVIKALNNPPKKDTKEEKQKKLDAIWEEIFFLQKEAAAHGGVLNFADTARLNDLTEQKNKLHKELHG